MVTGINQPRELLTGQPVRDASQDTEADKLKFQPLANEMTPAPAPVPVENTFQNRWEASNLYNQAQTGLESARASGQVAQDTGTRQAQEYAAALGLDPNSVAYRKIMANVQDAGIGQNVGIQRQAGQEARGLQEQFRGEDEAKALAALQMLNPNEAGIDAAAGSLVGVGGDLGGTVAGMVGGEGSGGLKEEYITTEVDETRDALTDQYTRENPGASEEEISAMVDQRVSEDLKIEEAGRTHELDVITAKELVASGDYGDISKPQWKIINADQQEQDAITDQDMISWWNRSEYFDDHTSGKVSSSSVEKKLEEDGIVDGGYIQKDGKVVQILSHSVEATGNLARPRSNPARIKITMDIFNPETGRTSLETKYFDRM
jgi:hypothetical protein